MSMCCAKEVSFGNWLDPLIRKSFDCFLPLGSVCISFSATTGIWRCKSTSLISFESFTSRTLLFASLSVILYDYSFLRSILSSNYWFGTPSSLHSLSTSFSGFDTCDFMLPMYLIILRVFDWAFTSSVTLSTLLIKFVLSSGLSRMSNAAASNAYSLS